MKVCDSDRRIRTLEFSTRYSTTRVSASACKMPLLLDVGAWNYVCLDLQHLSNLAFGAPYNYCKEVTVTANVLIARVYFQDRKYEDVELPAFLRVVP